MNDKPAFPVSAGKDIRVGGLTRRDLFAAMFEAGLLSNLVALRSAGVRDEEIESFATMRADALIAELDKEQP